MSSFFELLKEKGQKVRQIDGSVIISLKVTANAKKEQILKDDVWGLHIKVTSIAENDRANKAIIKLLSKTLGLSVSKIKLISGHKSRIKEFLLCYDEVSCAKKKIL